MVELVLCGRREIIFDSENILAFERLGQTYVGDSIEHQACGPARMRQDFDDAILVSIATVVVIGEEDALDVLNRFRFGIVGTISQRTSEPMDSDDAPDVNQRWLRCGRLSSDEFQP